MRNQKKIAKKKARRKNYQKRKNYNLLTLGLSIYHPKQKHIGEAK